MVEPATINLQHVARDVGIPLPQVQAVVELLDEGNTVPFITRYRKDQTGGLDEEQIRQVQERLRSMRLLAERKQTILRSIESQGKLTERLAKQIQGAATTKRLEDLYLPFKPKKQTLATLARSRALEPLAHEILMAAPTCADLDARAADFVNPDKGMTTAADALLGAGHILAEQFSENVDLRQRLRDVLQRTGVLVSSRIASAWPKEEAAALPTASEQEAPAAETPSEEVADEVNENVPDAESSAEEAPDQAVEAVDAIAEGTVGEPQEVASEAAEALPVAAAAGAEATLPAPGDLPAAAPRAVAQKPNKPSKPKSKKEQMLERKLKAFSDYFDYREGIKKIPPHRVLAINRGERARIVRVRIESDRTAAEGVLEEVLIPSDHPHKEFLRGCAQDALARLILPSLERELRREMAEKAEAHAVKVFARNLRNLLLQPPIHDARVLAVDPGYRSGCKLVAIDEFGNVLGYGVIYLVGKAQQKQQAKETVIDLVDRFALKVIVIGNGTACRETESFFAAMVAEELAGRDLAYVIVNEAGASVYSTSRLGREEFPEYDATLRGAVSIGRRLQDPLSELVKIDPARIGVGLYQHDVKAKHLHSSLDEVVESCVNYVGVNVNTASPALLRYVSGLNQLTARRIHEHRMQNGPFRNRQDLRTVPGVGDATFVQAAGFLQIVGGDQPFDGTWIHPESYETAGRVLALLGFTAEDYADRSKLGPLSERIAGLDRAATAEQLGVGSRLLSDILSQLARPGRDPREDLPKPVFKREVLKLEDLTVGMALFGTVLNVVDFGAFVDIGMHDSGLVHISQLANQFVRDPHDVVAVGDIVRVWVTGVDKDRRRVSLTMIAPGSKPAERPPRHKPQRPARPPKPEGQRPPSGEGQRPPRPEGQRSERPPGGRGGRPSGPRGPHGRQGGPGKERRFGKPAYVPKSRPKPVVPITKKMVAGVEPMRTFGDLAQFFEIKRSKEDQDVAQGAPETDEPISAVEVGAAPPPTEAVEESTQAPAVEPEAASPPCSQPEVPASDDAPAENS